MPSKRPTLPAVQRWVLADEAIGKAKEQLVRAQRERDKAKAEAIEEMKAAGVQPGDDFHGSLLDGTKFVIFTSQASEIFGSRSDRVRGWVPGRQG